MNKRINALICALALVLSLPFTACATETGVRASDYIAFTDVRAYAEDYGKILIEIDVDATHTMLEVGASDVTIYEQQSDGRYVDVYTYTMNTHNGLIRTNSAYAYIDVIYQGTIGKNYYAYVGCYARDSSGAETMYFTSPVVMADRYANEIVPASRHAAVVVN